MSEYFSDIIKLGGPGSITHISVSVEVEELSDIVVSVYSVMDRNVETVDSRPMISWSMEAQPHTRNGLSTTLQSIPYIRVSLESDKPFKNGLVLYETIGVQEDVSVSIAKVVEEVFPLLGRKLRMRVGND